MEEVKGRIHSIETMGTVDGPGIRYVVFVQGCPLRCLYCHNRDTRDHEGGREVTANEIVEDMKRYLEFIRASKGGITITGGEPTWQPEFVTEIFKQCRKINVHTALDTSGYVDIERVEELLSYTDLVLLDIKHAIEEEHLKLTGVSREKIEKFAHYVSDRGIDLWIRHVLVPGYTDSDENLFKIREIIKSLKTVKKVEVLPYHTMGVFKWEALGDEYQLKGVNPPSKELVKRAEDILGGKFDGT